MSPQQYRRLVLNEGFFGLFLRCFLAIEWQSLVDDIRGFHGERRYFDNETRYRRQGR